MTKRYTLAHSAGQNSCILAIVPEGQDIIAAVEAELDRAAIADEVDVDEDVEFEHDVVLTDEPEDGDKVLWSGHLSGVISDEDGNEFEYIVRRK